MGKGNGKKKPLVLDLPVDLTEQELLERGEELVKKFDQVDAIDATLAMAKSKAKADKEPLEDRIKDLKGQLRTKKEERPVECKREPDFAEGVVETIRLDTGEVVSARPVTPEERQESLLPPEPAAPEADDD